MKNIVILGAGTAGTIMANKLVKKLNAAEWTIIIIDHLTDHFYQPGFLFIPFGSYTRKDVVKKTRTFLPLGAVYFNAEVQKIDAEKNTVILNDNTAVPYDYCIIATGTQTRPDQTTGLTENLWRKSIFDFYTLDGAMALAEFFKTWQGGKLVMAIAETPIKCPIAPLEFVFLADDFFTKKGMRDKVDITIVTPQTGVFTKPIATKMLSDLLKERNINVESEFYIEKIDNEKKAIVSYDAKEISFDCLTIVPVNMGAELIANSGLGDDLNFVRTDKYTLQSEKYKNIFVLGDASNIPASKAGSTIHFAANVVLKNMLSAINGKTMEEKFDGHANCYLETGRGQATLIDFSYDTEPLSGKYPYAIIGPFRLLKLTRMNHWGKLIFKWLYWNFIIVARELPIPRRFSLNGKIVPKEMKTAIKNNVT